MASLDDINQSLNSAKADFREGAQQTLACEDQTTSLDAELANMWDVVQQLQRNKITAGVVGLIETVAVAQDAYGKANGQLGEVFGGEDTASLHPHIETAMKKGNRAQRLVTEGEQIGSMPSIGLEEIRTQTEKIGEYLAALLAEIGAVRKRNHLVVIHLEHSTHSGVNAIDAITGYQREKGLE
jgi:hypothetical protein